MSVGEVLGLRVKDFDFDRMLIQVQDSKGGKSRFMPLPASLVDRLKQEVRSRELVHEETAALENEERSEDVTKSIVDSDTQVAPTFSGLEVLLHRGGRKPAVPEEDEQGYSERRPVTGEESYTITHPGWLAWSLQCFGFRGNKSWRKAS